MISLRRLGRVITPEMYREELKIQGGQLVRISISNPVEGNV